MITLRVKDPRKQTKEWIFPDDQPVIHLGRSMKNDVPVSDDTLSRFHADIRRQGSHYYLYDLGSYNGTFLNQRLVSEPVRIQSEDVILAGETEVLFLLPSQPVSLEPVSTPATCIEFQEEADPSFVTSVFPSDDLALRCKEPSGDSEDLRQNAHCLSVLNQAAGALITFKPLNELLELIMNLVFDAIPAERGFLMLHEAKTGQLVPRVVWDRVSNSNAVHSIQISRSITRRVLEEKASILITDTRLDDQLRQQQSIIMQGVLSAMCAPLWEENKVIGLIYVDSRRSMLGFTNDNLKVLTSLANVAAIKIENTRLLEAAMEKQRMDEELALAGDIQSSLLPESPPSIPGYELTGFTSPTYCVGGDYYDFIPLPSGRIGIAIGDVSGKGISASLLMASLRASLISLVELQLPIAEMMARLNHFLCKNRSPNRFVTFFYGELDPVGHTFRYCNAGHNPPQLLSREAVSSEVLSAGGIVLGLIKEQSYQEAQVALQAGDCLVLYTDGISEASNEQAEEFGVERLISAIGQFGSSRLQDVQHHLIQQVMQYQGKGPQADDMTLVLLRRDDV